MRLAAWVAGERDDHLADRLLTTLGSGRLEQVQFSVPLTTEADCPAHGVGLILSTELTFSSHPCHLSFLRKFLEYVVALDV